MSYQQDFADWVCEDEDRQEIVAKALKREVNEITDDGEWMDELDWNDIDRFPNAWEDEFKNWWLKEREHQHMRNNAADMPSWAHFDLVHTPLLPRTTWLVHFTDEPDEVCTKGFKFGMADMETLGLTTAYTNKSYKKSSGGYNFAFVADSRYARQAASAKKYGKHAVLFQAAGVEVYHYGDEEAQIIFWGPAVDPRDIIPLKHYPDQEREWVVEPNVHANQSIGQDSKSGGLYHSESYVDAVHWVEHNYQQYRRQLSGRGSTLPRKKFR